MAIRHSLVIGGIRSGKTKLAEQLAIESAMPVVYVATATVKDDEMTARVRRHQEARPEGWGLAEEPIELGHLLDMYAAAEAPPFLLIDCMSLWVSNLLFAGDDVFANERKSFLVALANYPGNVVIVSNEVGLGTIGMDALTRRFCDELGWLNQTLAKQCDKVVMSVAGLAIVLKPS
ncbi:MAG TPA: bifunctional adenosylcobinamide kinase/adenosylcobinamide-phosphate guanylyltransferase [Marinobacter sp.]|nr:bifunctional adenosylcobinamide kinase/adenosylcobinamide-phosphate guanylyltransferase [Marinobacter sp.]